MNNAQLSGVGDWNAPMGNGIIPAESMISRFLVAGVSKCFLSEPIIHTGFTATYIHALIKIHGCDSRAVRLFLRFSCLHKCSREDVHDAIDENSW